jgi:hypothetical protein
VESAVEEAGEAEIENAPAVVDDAEAEAENAAEVIEEAESVEAAETQDESLPVTEMEEAVSAASEEQAAEEDDA